MFKKIIQALSLNDLLPAHRNEEQRSHRYMTHNLSGVSNTDMQEAGPSGIPQQHSVMAPHGSQNAFSSAVAGCSNVAPGQSYSPVRGDTGNLTFTSLMKPTYEFEAKDNAFFHMNTADMINGADKFQDNPNGKQFKVVLFNEACQTCPINYNADLMDQIRIALFASRHVSYKFLADMATSVSLNNNAIFALKENGQITDSFYRELHAQLKSFAQELTLIGNGYYNHAKSKPGFDLCLTFLVVETRRDKTFRNFFRRSAALHKSLKNFMLRHPAIKPTIINRLDTIVNQFIYRYFHLYQQPELSDPIQLKNYIKARELDQIQNMFKHQVFIKFEGHQFDAGGTEYWCECYSEMFNHMKKRDQIEFEAMKESYRMKV